ncbi:caldesmon-like [Helianthus annuus]|uniref:caldesmon-like n=1 Tax=Helianthus annuus TaxID=4232 RepID=UPI000B90682F|nr:caldesmon-like [Helianthus annuus]
MADSKLGAFIAQIVQEPELMKEWMDVFADDEKSQDEESVSSDDSSEKIKSFEDETTKKTIDRYCHLVQEMRRLEIKKEDDEWIDKLADALSQNKWWDKYIPANSEKSALVARILEEESVKSKPKRTKIFRSSESDEDTDDEEEYINKIEMLKEKRAARLKRELEELEARRIADEKAKMEAEKAKAEEKPTQKVEIGESEAMMKVETEPNVIEKVVEKIVEVENS